MTSGAFKFVTTFVFAIIVTMFVFGLAYEVQKFWDHGWMVCVTVLLGVLLFLMSLRPITPAETSLLHPGEQFGGKQSSARGKNEPFYGDPIDARQQTGDDRPLPTAIHDRVSAYVARRRLTDPDQFDREIADATSFNALIRREYRNGNL